MAGRVGAAAVIAGRRSSTDNSEILDRSFWSAESGSPTVTSKRPASVKRKNSAHSRGPSFHFFDVDSTNISHVASNRYRRSSGASVLSSHFTCSDASFISPIMEEAVEDSPLPEVIPSTNRGTVAGKPAKFEKPPTEPEGDDRTSIPPTAGRIRSVSKYYGSLCDVSEAAVVGEDEDIRSSEFDEGSSSDQSEETPLLSTSTKWTVRQWKILILMLVATCASSFAVCLFPPFFPRLAEEKGASATVYGFVIGTNCLTSFLVTPPLGKSLPKIGVKRAFVVGMIIGGICCGLSGFLQFFGPGWKFVATAVFIRICHATGNAMVIVSTFSYSAVEFQECVGTIFSFTRTAMNLAQLLGPSMGGAIYQCGGFYLPFISMGAMQTGMGLLMICLLPEISNSNELEDVRRGSAIGTGRRSNKISITNILRIPTIWFSFLTFIVATMCNGFLSINLEPRVLRFYNLKPFYIGLLFGLKDGANSISSPIWGYICDKTRKSSVKPYVIINAILVGASFFLLGAGSYLGIDIGRNMYLCVFALSLNGVGIGGEQVAGVVDALHEAIAAGYPDDPAMHGLIAGLWSSLSGAGRFVSRVGSGILVDYIGFNATACIVTALQCVLALSMLLYFLLFECNMKEGASVQWRDVTSIEDGPELEGDDDMEDEGGRRSSLADQSHRRLIFTNSTSPSAPSWGKTVSIDMPQNRRNRLSISSSMLNHQSSVSSILN